MFSLPKTASPSESFLPNPSTYQESSNEQHYFCTTVVGFFRQDHAKTNLKNLDACQTWQMEQNLGLIEQAYDTDTLLSDEDEIFTDWQRFACKLEAMNQKASSEVTYRLLYLGRHGQSYHNVGQMFYGDAAWDCYYCTFDHDPHVPNITFRDAHLTPLGIHQAQTASIVWQKLVSTQRIPLPQTYYSSPHSRAMQTAQLTFASLSFSSSQCFSLLIKESLREGYGIQSCDIRPSKAYIKASFPDSQIEENFTEIDELHCSTRREPPRHFTRRVRALLDDIFARDKSTYISMTSHGGTIEAILQVLGHEKIPVPMGVIIPVLVRTQKISGKRCEDDDDEEWELKPDCKCDPLKAGKQGYKDIAEFIEEINRSVPGTRKK